MIFSVDLGILFQSLALIIAISTLLFYIIIEHMRTRDNKNALFNALFDEIYHNINISRIFFKKETDNFLKDICNELERLYGEKSHYKTTIYPSPLDDTTLPPDHPDRKVFFSSVSLNTQGDYPPGQKNLMLFQTEVIDRALSSGITWNIAGKRAAHNIRHLYYSLKRLNFVKINYMNGITPEADAKQKSYFDNLGLDSTNPFHQLCFQYWLWVHFKLWFLCLDLALSSPRNIINHHFLCEIETNRW